MIRVLIAEDQSMVRGALASLLALEDDIEVVAEVGRGDEVLQAARDHHAEVALLDIEMPGQDGIRAAADLARELPTTRALMLTTFGRPGYLRRALETGAGGFLLKALRQSSSPTRSVRCTPAAASSIPAWPQPRSRTA
jgi:two-component system, NarL family, response regulator DesR